MLWFKGLWISQKGYFEAKICKLQPVSWNLFISKHIFMTSADWLFPLYIFIIDELLSWLICLEDKVYEICLKE